MLSSFICKFVMSLFSFFSLVISGIINNSVPGSFVVVFASLVSCVSPSVFCRPCVQVIVRLCPWKRSSLERLHVCVDVRGSFFVPHSYEGRWWDVFQSSRGAFAYADLDCLVELALCNSNCSWSISVAVFDNHAKPRFLIQIHRSDQNVLETSKYCLNWPVRKYIMFKFFILILKINNTFCGLR